MARQTLDLDGAVYTAGHGAVEGCAVWHRLSDEGYTNLVGWRCAELDLRDRDANLGTILSAKASVVVIAAVRVGGILANSTYPIDCVDGILCVQTNLFDAAHEAGVQRLLLPASAFIFPGFAPQAIPESALLTGPLDSTNRAYDTAKIPGIMATKSYLEQSRHKRVSAMPARLDGPTDNSDLPSTPVLPAINRKFYEAKASGKPVILLPAGSRRCEVLHVDDPVDAVIHVLTTHDSDETIKVGAGEDLASRVLAETLGYTGETAWDTGKPNGTPRRLLDDANGLTGPGWTTQIDLRDYFAPTCTRNLENVA